MNKQVLAFDFGGMAVKYGIVDETSQIYNQGEMKAPLESKEAFIDCICTLYNQFKNQVEGIAISMPGFIDSEKGQIYAAGAYTNIMANQNIFELLKELHIPVSIENDGKASALAELWNGSLKNVKNGAVIVIGTGLAGGIIMNGEIQKGPHLVCGEISLLMTEPGNYNFESCAGISASTTGLLTSVAQAKNLKPSQFGIAVSFQKIKMNLYLNMMEKMYLDRLKKETKVQSMPINPGLKN